MRNLVFYLILLMFLAGCASTPENGVSEKQQLTEAMTSIRDGYYDRAIEQFKALIEKASNDQQKIEAEMGLAYAYYKNDDFEQALSTCATFIEQNPTHPQLDYIFYFLSLFT